MNNRYFIMRSLSDVDLELSVAHGVWATQKRNTATLNAAFEGSQNVRWFGWPTLTCLISHSSDPQVYLIFSVLGSNSWYGKFWDVGVLFFFQITAHLLSFQGIARMEAPIPASKTHAVTKRLDGTQDPFGKLATLWMKPVR